MIVRKNQKVHTLEITPRALMNTAVTLLEHAVSMVSAYLSRNNNAQLQVAHTLVMESFVTLSNVITAQQI
jgi:hypothetical protein